MYLNEATLLNNIRTRYFKDRIYVSCEKLDEIYSSFSIIS